MNPWQTRFEIPTPGALLAGLTDPGAAEARSLCDRFGPGQVRWHGERWCWTVALPVPSGELILIPNPVSPRLGIRLATGYFAERPPESLPKPARDLLDGAVCVGDWTWTEWRLDSVGAAGAILGVLGLGEIV